MIDGFDILGLSGVALMNYSYVRVQLKREYAKQLEYSVINFFGAAFLVASLLDKWNVASFIGNSIWAFVSLYGIFRCVKYLRKRPLAFSLTEEQDNLPQRPKVKCQMPVTPSTD